MKSVCPDCGSKLKSKTNSIFHEFKGSGWTPRLTGPWREMSRAEMEHELCEAQREAEQEMKKKRYVT